MLAFGSVLLGGALAWTWHAANNPVSGGGMPDGFWATREKKRIFASFDPKTNAQARRLTRENANGWFGVFQEPVQSFEAYQREAPTRPTTTRRVVVLQPLGPQSRGDTLRLEKLRVYCQAFFQLPSRVASPLPLPLSAKSRPSSYFPGQRQFDAGALLSTELEPRLPRDAAAFLGVTNADLWSDDLSFVFGLGSWRERIGVYSLGRYFPKKPGQNLTPLDEKRALRRAAQVLNHEAGHMFGLTHCTVYKCSMNGSNSLADSDQTPLEFCPLCKQKIGWNIGFDSAKRERELRAFYRANGLESALWNTP